MNRIIIVSLLILSAIGAWADKKMTISNADTGESFEVMVPDGLRIYEYNGNWLDSIPYLTEHARWGEPWAYEALADCYRYGNGGVKRSFFTSLCLFELAGKNPTDVINDIRMINNDDPYVIFSRMIDYIEIKDFKKIKCAIDTLHESGYYDADILLQYINCNGEEVRKREIIEYIIDNNTTADACIFAASVLNMCEPKDTAKIEMDWALPLLLDKIPYFYSLMGENLYADTLKSDEGEGYADNHTEEEVNRRRKAVEYLIKADEHAMLTRQGARLLYHYCTNDSSSDWINLPEEDLYRVQQIARISE